MSRRVNGLGPVPCDFMLCGEAPGYMEERTGRPFVGPTGKELNRLLMQAGLRRSDFYATNVVKYRPATNTETGNNPPTLADIERDTPDLVREIKRVRPKWIVAIGRTAACWLFDEDVSVEDVEGFAFPNLPRANGAIVLPVRHPASGFHSPEQQPLIYWDVMRAGQYIRGELEPKPPIDEYPDPDYYEVKHALTSYPQNGLVSLDTEGYAGQVWSAQYSIVPGSAGLVLAKNKKAVEYLKQIVLSNTVLMHNSPWDLRIMAELFGMDLLALLYKIKLDDSMQAAFILRLVPKGLKALCRRHCGMLMKDYREVVREADKQKMLEWLGLVLRQRCAACNGAGSVMFRPKHKSTGRLLEARPMRCPSCHGDGTNWPPAPEVLQWKGEKLTVSRGHGMGSRIRGMMADRDKVDKYGRVTELRQRYSKFKKDNYDWVVQVEEMVGPPPMVSLGDVPFKEAKAYACADSDGTLRVWPELKAELDREPKLRQAYELDKSVIPIVTRMMEIGMKVDVQYLHRLTDKLTIQQDKILHELNTLVGRRCNPNSPLQVGEILFNDLGLHPVRLTETGAESTDAKVLTDLRIHCTTKMDSSARHKKAYEIITKVLEFKERGKLISTYTVPLPRLVDSHDRIHTQFKLAATESGRLASAEPNIQNISVRTELGKSVREAFICESGRLLVSVDYSQIEMRVLADMADEKLMIQAIRQGIKIHNLTCNKIFDIPIEKVSNKMWQYDAAKKLGFLIMYGGGPAKLKTEIKLESGKHTAGGIDVPLETCEEWINDYVRVTYPGVGNFMDSSTEEAKRIGYVESMYGHRRYLPGVHSAINKVRAEAERVATNHKIQSTAADLQKLGMSAVWLNVLPRFRKRGYAECIAQVHDELIFEVDEGLAEELLEEVVQVESEVVKLKVPITADGHVGVNWREVKDGSETIRRGTERLMKGMRLRT